MGNLEVSLPLGLFLGPPLANLHVLLSSGDLNKNEETPGLILEMIFYWEGAKIFGLSFPKRQKQFFSGNDAKLGASGVVVPWLWPPSPFPAHESLQHQEPCPPIAAVLLVKCLNTELFMGPASHSHKACMWKAEL